jgi:hypothetical protein
MRAARRAGKYPAMSAPASSTATAPANARASVAFTPKSKSPHARSRLRVPGLNSTPCLLIAIGTEPGSKLAHNRQGEKSKNSMEVPIRLANNTWPGLFRGAVAHVERHARRIHFLVRWPLSSLYFSFLPLSAGSALTREMVTLMSFTGSAGLSPCRCPWLIASTTSIPDTTWPKIVYC